MFHRYYGCGLVIPEQLDGKDVLDLGSGAGQDCFVLSKLVGESGSVTGVDMTDEQVFVDEVILLSSRGTDRTHCWFFFPLKFI